LTNQIKTPLQPAVQKYLSGSCTHFCRQVTLPLLKKASEPTGTTQENLSTDDLCQTMHEGLDAQQQAPLT